MTKEQLPMFQIRNRKDWSTSNLTSDGTNQNKPGQNKANWDQPESYRTNQNKLNQNKPEKTTTEKQLSHMAERSGLPDCCI
jgi:hypothetical protein